MGGRGFGFGRRAEEGLHLGHHIVVGQITRRRDNQVPPRVPPRMDPLENGSRHPANRFPGPQDGMPVRMATPEPGAVEVEYQVIRRILHRGDLLQDNLPFQGQISLPEEGMQNQVGQNLQREREVFVQHPGLEGGMLPGCVSIQGAAQAFQGQGDLLRRPVPGSLEHHVLQQVAGPHDLLGLVGRTLPDPHANGNGADPWDPLREHSHPVPKDALGHLPREGDDPGLLPGGSGRPGASVLQATGLQPACSWLPGSPQPEQPS